MTPEERANRTREVLEEEDLMGFAMALVPNGSIILTAEEVRAVIDWVGESPISHNGVVSLEKTLRLLGAEL